MNLEMNLTISCLQSYKLTICLIKNPCICDIGKGQYQHIGVPAKICYRPTPNSDMISEVVSEFISEIAFPSFHTVRLLLITWLLSRKTLPREKLFITKGIVLYVQLCQFHHEIDWVDTSSFDPGDANLLSLRLWVTLIKRHCVTNRWRDTLTVYSYSQITQKSVTLI